MSNRLIIKNGVDLSGWDLDWCCCQQKTIGEFLKYVEVNLYLKAHPARALDSIIEIDIDEVGSENNPFLTVNLSDLINDEIGFLSDEGCIKDLESIKIELQKSLSLLDTAINNKIGS